MYWRFCSLQQDSVFFDGNLASPYLLLKKRPCLCPEIYLRELPRFFLFVGEELVLHFQRLLPILCTFCRRPEPCVRADALKALLSLMTTCEARMSAHCGKLWELLLDVHVDLLDPLELTAQGKPVQGSSHTSIPRPYPRPCLVFCLL